jgi:hypothetical protein
MLMLKCRVINLNLLFKIESHSSSAEVSFLNGSNIVWSAMRRKEGKNMKESESIYNFTWCHQNGFVNLLIEPSPLLN